jgi:predicted nuclease of predicted toxin-antitoxin system
MKLLFDHNLSPKLVQRLADLFPDSAHVYALGLDEADDLDIWDYAQRHDLLVVTKDSDYNELLTLRGFPPKVIWIRRGNCSTNDIEAILRTHAANIETLTNDSTLGILTLY